jgi:hypothetical protein
MIFKLCVSEVSVCIQMIDRLDNVNARVWSSRRSSLCSPSHAVTTHYQADHEKPTVLSDAHYSVISINDGARWGTQYELTVDAENVLLLTIFGLQNWFSRSLSTTISDGGQPIAHPNTTHRALSNDMPHAVSTPSILDLEKNSIFRLISVARA